MVRMVSKLARQHVLKDGQTTEVPGSGGNCPHPDVLFAFTVGNLPGDLLEQVAAHLDTCPECRNALETLEGEANGLARLLRPVVEETSAVDPLPPRTKMRRSRAFGPLLNGGS